MNIDNLKRKWGMKVSKMFNKLDYYDDVLGESYDNIWY